MKRILVLGGGGVIGRNLCNALVELGHEAHAVDMDFPSNDLEPEEQRPKFTEQHVVDITHPNTLRHLVFQVQPNVIIHLAENNSIDPSQQDDVAHVNVASVMEMLRICARFSIRGIVGQWSGISSDSIIDPLSWSLHTRATMTRLFAKGNCVVNNVYIPRLLHYDYPASHFGNIVGRVWSHFAFGDRIIVDDNEYPRPNSEISDLKLSDPIKYCGIQDVVDAFVYQISRRTREPCHIVGIRASIEKLIGYALDQFNRETVTVYGRDEPHDFARIHGNQSDPIEQLIRRGFPVNPE